MDGAEKGYYKKSDMTLENVTEQNNCLTQHGM